MSYQTGGSMKKVFMAVVLMVALCGCGGGGGSSSSDSSPASSHVPGIAGLSYSPKSAALNSGGGAVTITGSFNFIDASGDINLMTINIQDATTLEVLNTVRTPITNTGGITAGVINFQVIGGTTKAGSYICNIHVNDAANNFSNPLTATFIIQ